VFIVPIVTWYLCAVLLAFGISAQSAPQETPPKAQENPPPQSESFYSGTIADLSAEKMVVTRTILGKSPEKRTFLITANTKVEGKLKAKSRVTVHFAPSDEGDVAVTVLVRDKAEKK
jgi:hypothetical protein